MEFVVESLKFVDFAATFYQFVESLEFVEFVVESHKFVESFVFVESSELVTTLSSGQFSSVLFSSGQSGMTLLLLLLVYTLM